MSKSKSKRKLLIPVVIIAAVLIGCFAWLSDYYPADAAALEAFAPAEGVEVRALGKNATLYAPEQPSGDGLIFYPGGKVDHRAYAPLMEACADRGLTCVLLEMPFRLAVFDSKAALEIPALVPEVEHWYLSGHSLGGAMAAACLAEAPEQFSGLVLLGAYSTADLSGLEMPVLSLYGSEDGVLNREKYEEYRPNLPADFREQVLTGGCHAYFGAYGPQEGDGSPTISNRDQIDQTTEAICEMVMEVRP